jgi:polyhydroxyalkanoate synthase subunit PhaC
MTQFEGEDQNDGTPTASSRRAPRKRRDNAAKVPRGQGQAQSLREEQHAAAEAQAAVDDLKRQLAAVEAALTEERQKATEAQRTLMEQLQAREESPKAPEPTTEETRAEENSFGLMPFIGFNNADLLSISQKVVEQTIKQPPLLLKHYTDFLTKMGHVATNQATIKPDPKDKRFLDEIWSTNPFYQMYLQTYLTWRQSLKAFIDEAGLDKKDAERAHFTLSLYVDAVAPTNTLLGNPAAMKKMYESGGTSLVKGLTHMLEDLANNGGLPSQVDMQAFQVGKDLAISPGSVIFRNDVLELIQYQPTTSQVYRRPILIVPPQVSKYYVMDLSPNKSLVKYLVANGLQVFTVSWHNPTPEHREWGFETYDQAILEATDVIRAITESSDINIVGVCLGGMTMAMLLGYLTARKDQRIHTATFLVTVLDTSAEITLGLFATKETIETAKRLSRMRGVVEGQEMARAFAWLRPNDLIWNYWVNNYLIGNDPAAFDVLYWNNDTTRLPARLHGEMLDLFETNAFTRPGALEILRTPIDLSKASNETYIVAGITDHITPWQACYGTTQLLGGKVKFILSSSGHIQALLNPPGNPKASYLVNESYPADPEQWLAGTQKRSGSWWEDWRDWLHMRAGEKQVAPQRLGNEKYLPGTPAPGIYVFEP